MPLTIRGTRHTRSGRRPQRRPTRYRPDCERLEDRCLLASAFLQTNLTSDIRGLALNFDPNLVNPWGLTAGARGPFWVSDNNAGVSTLYNGQGQAQSLVVSIPQPDGTPGGTPTGVVNNSSPDFVVSEGTGPAGPAAFIFATEDGTISGWNPGVDLNNAVLMVDNSGAGAVYKGLAIGQDPDGRNLLYAANLGEGTIDVFDRNFHDTTVGGTFTDPNLPAGYVPFNIQNINNKLYVTYALQDDTHTGDVAGPGNGFVDVYDTNGHLMQRLISNGPLNSPWGVALAPSNFGDFSNDLLVGNFGDGHINAFTPGGTFLGPLKDPHGNPIVIGGLWALRFGNDGAAGSSKTLFFTAGIDHENHGLFGEIQAINPVSFAAAADAGATAVLQTNLTSDLEGVAANQDPNLQNPWGMTPTNPFWVSDNNSGVSTLYNGQGQPQSLVVNIPQPDGTPGGSPTGVVFNGGPGFRVSENGATGRALFLFATEEGTISGWSPGVDLNNAVIAVDNSGAGADYTGLTMGTDSDGRQLLYAANFGQGTIDVFDAAFLPTHTVGGDFTDPNLPDGFVPYNIQNIGGKLYVTYSRQDGNDRVGDGFVDVYSTDGVLLQRLISGGPLDEPWGLTVAPATYGAFANDLLVGNVRNGQINAFTPGGTFVGPLKDGLGNTIAINGLWALNFGTGAGGSSPNTLYFTAGIGGYQDGLLGSLEAIHPVTVQG
jgi:uncharacterized protein (TIGR03118 family)